MELGASQMIMSFLPAQCCSPSSLSSTPTRVSVYPPCLETGLGRRWESVTNCIMSRCTWLWNLLYHLNQTVHSINSQSLKNFLCRFGQRKYLCWHLLKQGLSYKTFLLIFKASKMGKMPSFCLISILRRHFLASEVNTTLNVFFMISRGLKPSVNPKAPAWG